MAVRECAQVQVFGNEGVPTHTCTALPVRLSRGAFGRNYTGGELTPGYRISH